MHKHGKYIFLSTQVEKIYQVFDLVTHCKSTGCLTEIFISLIGKGIIRSRGHSLIILN